MKKTTASNMLPIMAFFAATVVTSCSSDSLVTDGNSGNSEGKSVTLTAKVNESEAATRVGMNKEDGDAVSFYWHSGDAILVQTVSGSTYSGAKFTTSTATGEATAEFTGAVESAETLGTYAVYPYSDKHSFTSATALTYNLPATYTYNKVESGIFSKTEETTTYRSTSTNIPMVGTVTDDAISFKHIGGLAVIRIDEMPAETGTLTVTADEQLCDDFAISNLSATDAAIETSTSAATNNNKTVTFSFSGATANGVGVFYLPLATGEYTNLTIKIAYGDANSTTQTIPYGSLTIARGEVVAIPLSADSKGNLRYIVDNGDGTYTINNGHRFVDLGLSSGLLWAVCNVGASSATEDGNYYAWGEVAPKADNNSYTWDNYKFGTKDNLTKYTGSDGRTTLEAEDDAATVNWGSGCRIPTKDEIDELTNSTNCTWTSTTVNEVKGYEVTSKMEGYTDRSIFLPASGFNYDSQALVERGSTCSYWTSTLDPSDNPPTYAYIIRNNDYGYGYRFTGRSVRPVAEKP